MVTPAEKATVRQERQYTVQQVGEALALLTLNGGNVYKTAKELKIPRQTLDEWAKGKRRVTPEVVAIRREKEGTLEQKFERIAHLYADRLSDPAVIDKASPLDAAKVAGIAVDKRQILTGMPTSITCAVMSDDDRRLRIAELLSRIAARNGQPAPQPVPQPEPQDVALLQG
jgi:hypothetical protein